ncbi:hypothetical protein PR048_006481 [Dryococelus australis]|uniref:Gustatory receptor n=1 Tax=Dryococelus australis TaxID=614101 RepID=A0ABQ9IB33_9NEOP|nr:hypothetical protein PR048_006481 [Dryococelus australis]
MVYGFPVTCIILAYFINCVTTAHLVSLSLSRSHVLPDFACEVTFTISHAMWYIIYTSQAVAIVWACSSTNREARKITSIIYNLLLQPGLDKEASDKLKEFSLQASREKLQFNGGGFAILDLPLLPSMCVSVISYLLVLLQWD